MGYIHCCAGLRKSKTFSLKPEKEYQFAQIDFLEECPVCGHCVVQITRIDLDNKISICRKVNQKARCLFDKLKKSIIFEKKSDSPGVKNTSKFYLYYNEFGVKKKCYSNLSSLKMGLFDNQKFINKDFRNIH